jgi:hypothetical protein
MPRSGKTYGKTGLTKNMQTEKMEGFEGLSSLEEPRPVDPMSVSIMRYIGIDAVHKAYL